MQTLNDIARIIRKTTTVKLAIRSVGSLFALRIESNDAGEVARLVALAGDTLFAAGFVRTSAPLGQGQNRGGYVANWEIQPA